MEADISVEIQELLKREETLWKQKSREQWLTSSDLNTRFFYLSTVIRRRRNYIEFMKDEHGSWLTKREDIGKCFCRNFVKLFNSDNPQFPLDLEGLVPCCISEEENDQLVTPLSPEEVKAAVFAMKSNKAPGPDGMSPIFYKHYWHIICLGRLITHL
jgi:hypothetical protein